MADLDQSNSTPEAQDSRFASILRHTSGIFTVVAGVMALGYCIMIWWTAAAMPPPLDSLLPTPGMSHIAFSIIAFSAVAGGIAMLRGAASGVTICSGTWAVLAALAARPSVRFEYSSANLPLIQFPAAGESAGNTILFVFAASLSLLTHGYSDSTHRDDSKLYATLGETLVSAFLLVCGVAAAITFQADTLALGSVVVERALLPLMIASVLLQTIGMGVLAGWAVARALAIILLLGVALASVLPDLLFERLEVAFPAFWCTACALGAAALLLPRRMTPLSGHRDV